MGKELCRPARYNGTGLHWVRKGFGGAPLIMRWCMNFDNGEMEWWDFSRTKMVSSENETARDWVYLGPAVPPDVVKALVDAGARLKRAIAHIPLEDGSTLHHAVETMEKALAEAKEAGL
jgi:hypothetical protein